MSLLNTLSQSRIIHLLVKRRVISTLGIYVVSKHSVSVDNTTDGWICVPSSVGMESRLAKVRGEGRISEPSRSVVKNWLSLFHIFKQLSLGSWNLFLWLRCSSLALDVALFILEYFHRFLLNWRNLDSVIWFVKYIFERIYAGISCNSIFIDSLIWQNVGTRNKMTKLILVFS